MYRISKFDIVALESHKILFYRPYYITEAQLVASVSGVVLGGVVEVVSSNPAGGEIFSASIGTVDLLYLSVFIFCVNLHQFLILCSPKALLFVKLYFRTTDNDLISLVSLTGSLMLSHAN